ncbi:MAG: DUF1015 domain-containing protein [Deltaproteobacteria bacterium HGW-Deltaproteobacteria-12]|jgi:uncharacterized protein (DUF1015 family)|nr:MAG: DUF1015 domain-containing protein [Deltaproteobacteria bacterium HGW-Deltaproteobacteria-12]
MALVLPFRAVRPQRQFVAQVAALPYDVMTRDEAKNAVYNTPFSFLHVEKSEIDVPDQTNSNDPLIYTTAKRNFAQMQEQGLLFQEESPCFYIYRQQMGEQIQTGIVGVVSAREYDEGKIKKHELTRQDKEDDRIKHVNEVNAQTGPVFITYKSRPQLNDCVDKAVSKNPEYNFTADDGVIHTVWVVEDVRLIEDIKNEFLAIESLYIADGHHRAAAASAVARMKRQNDKSPQNRAYEKVLAVLFPHNQLKVMDYNRAVKDLNGLSPQEFKEKISSCFIIKENFTVRSPQRFHDFGMYLQGQWYQLTIKKGAYQDSDPVARLDAAILQDHLLAPILGINDPRTDERIKFIGGIRGMAELEKLVDKDGYAVAFSLYPTTIEQVMQVADAGAIMPPKSTWFEPKLRSGIFVHKIS